MVRIICIKNLILITGVKLKSHKNCITLSQSITITYYYHLG